MKTFILWFLVSIPVFTFAQLNGLVLLSGKVVDEQGKALPSASVSIAGTSIGAVSDSTGHFSLVANQKFPFRLIISSVGYAPQEIEVKTLNSKLNVQLSTQTFIANEVVVSASRRQEKLLSSPVLLKSLTSER